MVILRNVAKLGMSKTTADAIAAAQADTIIIVGTSMQVYPAASLVGFANSGADIYYVDPNPSINYELGRSSNLEVISENATTGVRKVVNKLMTSFRN